MSVWIAPKMNVLMNETSHMQRGMHTMSVRIVETCLHSRLTQYFGCFNNKHTILPLQEKKKSQSKKQKNKTTPNLKFLRSACVLSHFSCVRLFATLQTAAHQASPSMRSSGKNTGMACHFLLQGIFLTQESNLSPLSLLCLLYGRQFLYLLSH